MNKILFKHEYFAVCKKNEILDKVNKSLWLLK